MTNVAFPKDNTGKSADTWVQGVRRDAYADQQRPERGKKQNSWR